VVAVASLYSLDAIHYYNISALQETFHNFHSLFKPNFHYCVVKYYMILSLFLVDIVFFTDNY